MDLFDLLIIAFLLLPALLRWIGKKSQPQTGEIPGPDVSEAEPHAESAFERALREISRSLEQETQPAEPTRKAPQQPPQQAPAAETAFAREESFERHGRSRAPSTPALPSVPFRKLKHTRIETAPPEAAMRARHRHRLSHQLREARSARDAVLFAEVLGPPVAYRDRRW